MRPEMRSSSIAVTRLRWAMSAGMQPRKCPTPALGSRMLPPWKPRRRRAAQIQWMTSGVGVVAVVDRCPRRVVVVGREQLAQATGALDPGWIPAFVVEARRDAAPAGVAQKCATFAGARLPGFALDRAKRVDGRHVGVELGRLAFDVVEDLVVPCRPLEQLRGVGRGGHGGAPCLGDPHFLDLLGRRPQWQGPPQLQRTGRGMWQLRRRSPASERV
jgi:hypothetical protein